MATKDIHDEIPRWKDLENLVKWKQHQYSNLFPQVYWLMGIFFFALNILVVQAKETIIEFIGVIPWALIVILFTLLFIWMLFLIAGANKTANGNIEYLCRKKDGQDV